MYAVDRCRQPCLACGVLSSPSLRLFACLQAVAAVLSDGSLALLSSVEEDLWEETLEEQLEAQPWDRCVLKHVAGAAVVVWAGARLHSNSLVWHLHTLPVSRLSWTLLFSFRVFRVIDSVGLFYFLLGF